MEAASHCGRLVGGHVRTHAAFVKETGPRGCLYTPLACPGRREMDLARIPFPSPFAPCSAHNWGIPRAMVSPCCTRGNRTIGSASYLGGLAASPIWHYYACVWERPSNRSNLLCRGGRESSPRPGRAKYESIMIESPGGNVNRQHKLGGRE